MRRRVSEGEESRKSGSIETKLKRERREREREIDP